LLYTWASLDHDPPIYASHVARVTGAHHHIQLLLVEMGSLKLFVQLTLNLDSLDLHLLNS
jgi:hypothetical protein